MQNCQVTVYQPSPQLPPALPRTGGPPRRWWGSPWPDQAGCAGRPPALDLFLNAPEGGAIDGTPAPTPKEVRAARQYLLGYNLGDVEGRVEGTRRGRGRHALAGQQ